ncbi:MAG TPA: YncE family protein [Pyrinomonadaceae bacterium]|nr:YncE family protein [Pyrinomonadaceae bacterium]
MFKSRLNPYSSVPVLLLVLLFGSIGQKTVKADTVIQSIAVGSTPMDVAVSPSGDRVYVTNQGSNTVSVIDTTTTPNTVIANVAAPAGSILTNLAVNPANTKVFVVSQNTGILVLNTGSLTFNASPITVGTTPIDVAFDSAGNAYVTNYTTWNVSIIDTLGVVRNIGVHEGPRGITVANIGGAERVYFACAGASNSEVGYFAAGAMGGSVTHFNVAGGAFFVAARPDGAKIYVSLNASNQTASITTAAIPVVTTFTNSGGAPFGVAVAATPTGNRVFVADSNGTGINWDLTRISSTTTTDSLLTLIGVTKKPKGVAANAAGTRVYVACLGTGSAGKVDVIDTTI